MKRRLVAAAWIFGATVPLLLATLYAVGCCALPFHSVMHKLMPICEFVASAMEGDDEQPTSTPEPVKRIVTVMPHISRLMAIAAAERIPAPAATTAYRSFIALGAIRCDRDVGLHLLVETFRI